MKKKKSHRGKRKKRPKSELETELKARDDEMAQLTDDLADLIPVSETLKEENEQLKAQMEEGDQERIDMLGKFLDKIKILIFYLNESLPKRYKILYATYVEI